MFNLFMESLIFCSQKQDRNIYPIGIYDEKVGLVGALLERKKIQSQTFTAKLL